MNEDEKMTRENFIIRWLGLYHEWNESNVDKMRDDLDKVINFHSTTSEAKKYCVCKNRQDQFKNEKGEWICADCELEIKQLTTPEAKDDGINKAFYSEPYTPIHWKETDNKNPFKWD